MSEFQFDIEIDEEALQQFLERGIAAVAKATELTAIDLWGNIRAEAPVDEGRLAGSFTLDQVSDEEWRIATDVLYALFVHEGTGIYGPTGMPITPVSASVLVFQGDAGMVFAKSVSGSPPNPYVDRAMDRTSERIDEFASMALDSVGLT